MIEVIFLLILAFIWILFAAIYDLKTTEIPNWLNFSFIIFALGFRFFYSLFSLGNFNFFYQGIIGLSIFIILGNLLYYCKIFAGGDAKLMIALGTILPFSYNLVNNLQIFISFLFLFFFCGSLYGIAASGYFAIKNFKKFRKEFVIRYKKSLSLIIIISLLGILTMVYGLFSNLFLFYFGIFIFLLPVLYIYLKSIDESCMLKRVNSKLLIEGDWLYKDVKVGNKTIKADWGGLKQEDIKLLIKKKKFVIIRQGVAFGPVFLISFLLLLFIYFVNSGLWNSFW
jgi:Flp pilus assembly protein protease CpaA